jgi:hypothetical protein
VSVRPDVEELLRAGYGDRTIARQVGVSIGSVTRARTLLGLPKARGGNKAAASPEDLYWRRVKPVDGGHMEWTGHRNNRNTPVFKWRGRDYSGYRIAYRAAHGHDPIGQAHVTCDNRDCVAPAHIGDTAVTRRRAYHKPTNTPNGSREEIVALLRAGLSNTAISKQLRTDMRRVATVRREENLGPAPLRTVTFAEKWAAATEATPDGHVRWTGRLRDGITPSLVYRGRDYSARRAAFEELHGRDAVGLVLPGCGWDQCVRPDHLEDRPMREQLANQYQAIFGEAAA